jgi:hypothetical protein
MRYMAYILLLIVVWSASMAALAFGLDGLEHPPFVPHALLAGAYFGAISTVSWPRKLPRRKSGNKAVRLPCRWEGWC